MSTLLFGFSACSDDFFGRDALTPEQEALIGRAVNFNVSMAEEFRENRVNWNHEGGFNEGDLMMIYRQYWDAKKNDWETTQAFRTYHYDVTYATGTSINLSTDWKVFEGRMMCDDWNGTSGTIATQDKSDSITWEDGRTVRFRAWSRSNVANCIGNGEAGYYYPDFCIADWVTVSGPTMGIPLNFRHLCSRIGFSPRSGNEFRDIKICLDPKDYQWQDNSDSHDNDVADAMTPEQAAEAVAKVKAAYNRMCMPAGVNIENGTLRTMTRTLYNSLSASKQFNIIEQKTAADGIVEFGDMTPKDIATDVVHPEFSSVEGLRYMITIPYDMSNGDTQGEVITLPAETRFKIMLRDVNNGDHDLSTSGYEWKEHIFALSDIKENGQPKYPDGLLLTPGKSYRFTVGYQYDKLTVTVVEEGFNWAVQDKENGTAADQSVAKSTVGKYQWYKNAIRNAVIETKQSADYNPVFQISTAEDFREFIALVNGTAATKTSGLERALRSENNPEADDDLDDKTSKRYWWYDVEATRASLATEFGDTVWVTRQQAELQGYIFYRHYYHQISDQSAHSLEDYVRGPVSFFDEQVNLHLVVQLANDIDLHDWQLESIGATAYTPFKGYFDGGTHLLSNVNMANEYLFGHMEDGEIRNLRLASTHNLSLLGSGTTSGVTRNLRIVGVSVKADCTQAAIAQTLNGTAYVIGCIHEGNAGQALVGEANNLTMYGCMHASANLTGAALLGAYGAGSKANFFDPQTGDKVVWSNFMCNYYQKSPTQATKAVGDIADNYRPQEYIRGARQHILRAKWDNLLDDEVPYDKLKGERQKEEFYGLAPWKAMNYAIFQYNQMSVAKTPEYKYHPESHQCEMVYTVEDFGYAHLYPQLVAGTPTNEGIKNITYLNN